MLLQIRGDNELISWVVGWFMLIYISISSRSKKEDKEENCQVVNTVVVGQLLQCLLVVSKLYYCLEVSFCKK